MFNFFINNELIWSTQTEHLNLLMIKLRAFIFNVLGLISIISINAKQGLEHLPPNNIKSVGTDYMY